MKKLIFNNSSNYADQLDKNDQISKFQNDFHYPEINGKKTRLYFCGNSLGLQPKRLKQDIIQEIDDWKKYAVEGHFKAKNSWYNYHNFLNKTSANLVGAKDEEVIIMNSLSVNLHLLMVSFYKPNKNRKKILIESNAFPSDFYAVQSQLKFHNNDPENDLIVVQPDNNKIISTERIISTIETNKNDIALILLGGVNYLTGQLFNIEKISNVAKKYGCIIGLDLAHAVGNIKLELNKWNIDFAAWCGYKYLNGGPGAPSGAFINLKHIKKEKINRFEGWWGHDKSNRFFTAEKFKPIRSAEAWQLSNPPILSMAALLSSLKIFEKVGMNELLYKSSYLTSYLEYLLKKNLNNYIKIITPTNKNERGCQLSVELNNLDKNIIKKLYKKGVMCDFREPNILRIAPVPLYNSYRDCYDLVRILKEIII